MTIHTMTAGPVHVALDGCDVELTFEDGTLEHGVWNSDACEITGCTADLDGETFGAIDMALIDLDTE